MAAGFTYKQATVEEIMQDFAEDIIANVSNCVQITENVNEGEYLIYYETDSLYINIRPVINNVSENYVVGFEVVFCSLWNTYTQAPDGTIQYSNIPIFYDKAASQTELSTSDKQTYWFSTKKVDLRYWSDEYGIQLHVSYPYNPTGWYGWTMFYSIEFIPASYLEFNDGYSHIFTTAYYNGTSGTPSGVYGYFYTHPFLYNGSGVNYSMIKAGYESKLTGEVYFEFPWIYNDVGTLLQPIYRTNRWFILTHAYNSFIPGSIIEWNDNGTTRKFIVVDTKIYTGYTSSYFIAMPYETAKAYE